MTKKLDVKLWTVAGHDGRVRVSQIEALSEDEAKAKALGDFLKCEDPSTLKCESEEIWEGSLGLEQCDDSDGAVFEIKVRGTSRKAVDRLVQALYVKIGGPGMSDEEAYERETRPDNALSRELGGYMAFK